MILTAEQKQTVNLLFTIISLLESKRPYAVGHSKRVAELARMLAKELDLGSEEVDEVFVAALLHDIGYLALPDALFASPEPLTAAEQEMLHSHPQVGLHLLGKTGFLKSVSEIVASHHHRYDGHGNPADWKGKRIPLGARIIYLVETFEALSNPRPHRRKMGAPEALEAMLKEAGRFDPDLLQVFIRLLERKAGQGQRKSEDSEELSRKFEAARAKVLAQGASSPVAPRAVAIIERLLRDLKASFAQISGVIELEPSLALKLISVANSPLFAGLMPVKTVGEALTRVGLNEAREILITFMYQNLFQAHPKTYHHILSRWWEHALLTAMACQGLASRVKLSQPSYAYLLGLLHDIGKPCLLKAFADEWGEAGLSASRSEELLALIDRHHRQVAENIISGSGFPAIFLRAVRAHGLPHKDALAPEVLLLNAANDIVQAVQAGKEVKAETFQEMVSIALLGLSPQDLETIVEATVKRYNSIIQVFGG